MTATNMGRYTGGLLIATLISWELSASHFNMGLTLAELFMNFGNGQVCGAPFWVVISAQIIGVFTGLFLSWLPSRTHTWGKEGFDHSPMPSVAVCPS